MDKVIKGGKVAVLVSPGYGAGWYSWNSHSECLFHPTIVNLVLNEQHDKITKELCKELFGDDFYAGGASDLEVEWVPEGNLIKIDEYDGSESLVNMGTTDWIKV